MFEAKKLGYSFVEKHQKAQLDQKAQLVLVDIHKVGINQVYDIMLEKQGIGNIDPENLKQVLVALETYIWLQTKLVIQNIGFQELKAIASSIEYNTLNNGFTSLTLLHMGPDEINLLCDALKHNNNIKEVSVEQCSKISEEILISLFEMFKISKSVLTLDLRNSGFGNLDPAFIKRHASDAWNIIEHDPEETAQILLTKKIESVVNFLSAVEEIIEPKEQLVEILGFEDFSPAE